MSELNLILLGPPGAGKGTQADRLKDDFGLPYIGTGELLRNHKRSGTELGREASGYMDAGELVPDELVIRMILEEIDEKGGDGFLLDGYPRSVAQADALAAALEGNGRRLTAVLLIDADDETVIQRLSGRRQCVKNGHLYHVEFDPPKNKDGYCDIDGSRLVQREDDEADTIRRRLTTYHDKTKPLIDYYEQRGLLRRFDGMREPNEVHDHVRATLATLRLEERL
jgi:adenylate kinase